VYALALFAQEIGPEEYLRRPEAGRSNLKGLAIRQLVGKLLGLHGFLLLRVGGQIADLLLDGAHNLKFGGRPEVEALPADECLQVARHIAPGDVHAHNTVRHGESLVDGNRMRHTVAGVEHHACHASGGIAES